MLALYFRRSSFSDYRRKLPVSSLPLSFFHKAQLRPQHNISLYKQIG